MNIICDNVWPVKGWKPNNIRRLRATLGWTQTKFAMWLGVTQVHVAHLESGFRPAGPQTVRLLALLMEKLQRGDIKAAPPRTQKQAKP